MPKPTELELLTEIRDLLKALQPIPVAKPKNPRFEVLPDGWVKDKQLGLEWGPTYPDRISWDEALRRVKKAGRRLPTVTELFSLVDYARYDPVVDKETFPDTKNDYYWAKETCAWNSGYAWLMNLSNGSVSVYVKDSGNYVRPVREAK